MVNLSWYLWCWDIFHNVLHWHLCDIQWDLHAWINGHCITETDAGVDIPVLRVGKGARGSLSCSDMCTCHRSDIRASVSAPAWFYMGCAKGDKTEWVDLEPWVRCGDFCICLFLEYAMVHRLLFPWDAFKRAVSDVLMSWNLFLQQMFQQIVSLLPPLQQVFLTE